MIVFIAISFLVGSMFGILLMCLVQINRLHGDPEPGSSFPDDCSDSIRDTNENSRQASLSLFSLNTRFHKKSLKAKLKYYASSDFTDLKPLNFPSRRKIRLQIFLNIPTVITSGL